MKHIFHLYHPAAVFLYIMAALIFSMITLNPVCIVISFLAASGYSIYLNGAKSYLKTLRFVAVMFVIISIINPLFNHNGVTILFYMTGNPITLEACLFGMASGGMLACIFIWFTCYNKLMTNEKFLHLFGKAMPTIALMLSMILRLVPTTRYKIRCITNAGKAMGIKAETRRKRIAHGVRASSILLSWTMEDSIETAESMNARGYGVAKRTSFTAFKHSPHDIITGAIITALVGAAIYMMIVPFNAYVYYPTAGGELITPIGIVGYVLYALLLCFPLLLEFRETIKWR
jgi:energy-coupling factor transport system permease protein